MNQDQGQDTVAARALREWEAARNLRRTHPRIFMLSVMVLVGAGVYYVGERIWNIERYKHEAERLQHDVDAKQVRIIELETQLAPFKTAAILKYGGDDKLSIAKLTEDVRNFDEALRAAIARVRTFSIIIEAEFIADWKNGSPPDPSGWLRAAGGGHGSVALDLQSKDVDWFSVEFSHSDGLRIEKLPSGYVRLSMTADAKPGGAIFGTEAADIRSIRNLWFVAYGLEKANVNAVVVQFRTIDLRFFVNGNLSFRLHHEVPPNAGVKVADQGTTKITLPGPLPIEHLNYQSNVGLPGVQAARSVGGK